MYERGQIEEEQCYDMLEKQLGVSASELRAAIVTARSTIEYDQELVSFIRDLRKETGSTLQIIATSNISKPDYDSLRARWGPEFWSLFDKIFTSATVGMRKPDMGFFHHVLQETGAEPRRTIFIDDNIQNTVSAGSLGLPAVLFESLATLAQSLRILLFDPVTRGNAYLQRNAKQLYSFTDCGTNLLENYVQLLILEATGNEQLITLGKPDYMIEKTWNFYIEEPTFTTMNPPNDTDTTTLAMQLIKLDDATAQSILDETLEYLNQDGLIEIYYDHTRPRVDPVASVNIFTAFHLYGRGHQVRNMLEWIRNVLYHRAYLKGTYYYRTPEWFLFHIHRLLLLSNDSDIHQLFRSLLRERIQERIGISGDSIALAMRVIVCNAMNVSNRQDREALMELQSEDGGWEAGHLYSIPIVGKKIMNRGLPTALAVQALTRN